MSIIQTAALKKTPFFTPLTPLEGMPEALHYRGTLPNTPMPSVAIVGTRKPSSYGKEVTYQCAYQLAQQGVVIISGLAYGVDAIAHRAALDAGGTTIALLAHGLHKIYPARNAPLAEEILRSGGALISEYDSGTEAKPYTFLARNRLVSGLSDCVVITEAAAKSGTLNTAGHALQQGKDVYATPGNITNPLSAGCNHLLSQGAIPYLSPDVLIERFTASTATNQLQLPIGANDTENAIIEHLHNGVRDADELFSLLHDADISDFNTALTMLEINGSIRSLGANKWSL